MRIWKARMQRKEVRAWKANRQEAALPDVRRRRGVKEQETEAGLVGTLSRKTGTEKSRELQNAVSSTITSVWLWNHPGIPSSKLPSAFYILLHNELNISQKDAGGQPQQQPWAHWLARPWP